MSSTEDTSTEQTEQTATAEVVEPASDQPEQAVEPPIEAESKDEGKEAAKYRHRLREAEAQRDALGEKVTALQRLAVETEARKHLRKPEALWAAGADLAGLLDENGLPDPVKVEAASNDAVQRLGLNTTPKPDPSQGKSSYSGPSAPSFSDAFKPSRR